MSKNITLDQIREAAEAKYGSTDITVAPGQVVKLLNPLRLKKKNRDELMKIQEKLTESGESGEDVDQEEMLRAALRLVAESPKQAKALIDAIGEDLAVLSQVFEEYTKGTQAGEA